MKLYTLLFGKSKKKMRPIMTDEKYKCENYEKARQNVEGWHKIVEALPGEEIWRQKSATIGGNKCTHVARVGKAGGGFSGYIGKNGFNAHT